MTEIVIFFLSLWIITLIGIQYWRAALTHLPNKYVYHDAVMVTFDVKSPPLLYKKGQAMLSGKKSLDDNDIDF